MFLCDLSSVKFTNVKSSCNENKPIVLESINSLETFLSDKLNLKKGSYYVLFNGKKLVNGNEDGLEGGIFHVVPRTYGGKGGFGSMLRAIGAQIEKTTNREACRDLSGRRLRDINEEQRLKNWIAQKADREKQAADRKKKKLERLCQEPKHEFKDEKYDESRTAMPEKISDSIDQGLKASTSGSATNPIKRKTDVQEKTNKSKKKRLWIDADNSCSSSDESEEVVSH